MCRVRAVAALVMLCGVSSGCTNLVAGLVGDAVGVPLHEKVIRSKVEPDLVIAIDGATCVVTKGRWAKAKVGEKFLCSWSDDSDQSNLVGKAKAAG